MASLLSSLIVALALLPAQYYRQDWIRFAQKSVRPRMSWGCISSFCSTIALALTNRTCHRWRPSSWSNSGCSPRRPPALWHCFAPKNESDRHLCRRCRTEPTLCPECPQLWFQNGFPHWCQVGVEWDLLAARVLLKHTRPFERPLVKHCTLQLPFRFQSVDPCFLCLYTPWQRRCPHASAPYTHCIVRTNCQT